MRIWILAIMLWIGPSVQAGAESSAPTVRRTILALYSSRDEQKIFDARIHHIAEMPLNYLGLVPEYHDIESGLPPLDGMSEVRGVLTWFLSDSMPDPAGFLRWAEAVVDSGRKFVILGDLAAGRDYRGRRTPLSSINRFLTRLGLRAEGEWVRITYDARLVHRDPSMVEFERPLHGVLPPFEVFRTTNPEAVSYLRVRRGSSPEGDSDLVVISPTGGLAAQGYILYQNEDFQKRQLYLNPFEFFRLAFGTDDLPKPDFTTLCGRRIYYSHVDGDGWRNLSDIEAYRARGALSSEVILERI
ncbi:MAG: hypothetical protein FJW35_09160, partial [Acidobacteria bacterium]|nr:hypothetical protein [Acidobacteriota bacterium]